MTWLVGDSSGDDVMLCCRLHQSLRHFVDTVDIHALLPNTSHFVVVGVHVWTIGGHTCSSGEMKEAELYTPVHFTFSKNSPSGAEALTWLSEK